jgi:hypothetical protein
VERILATVDPLGSFRPLPSWSRCVPNFGASPAAEDMVRRQSGRTGCVVDGLTHVGPASLKRQKVCVTNRVTVPEYREPFGY